MWTSQNRACYDRSKLRYPSDLTDDEWRLVEPLIPPGKRGGGKRTVIMREVVNGLMYVLSTAEDLGRERTRLVSPNWHDHRTADPLPVELLVTPLGEPLPSILHHHQRGHREGNLNEEVPVLRARRQEVFGEQIAREARADDGERAHRRQFVEH